MRRLPQREQTSRPQPIDNRCFGTVPSSHLRGIGLNLVLTCLAPNDDPDAGLGRAT
jgi:hypothetical protein